MSPSLFIFNLVQHPDYNKTNHPWIQSPNGKAWLAKGKHSLTFTETLAGGTFNAPKLPVKPTTGTDDYTIIASLVHDSILHDLVPMYVTSNNFSVHVLTLIDTGALQANYVSEKVANQLKVNPRGPRLVVE